VTLIISTTGWCDTNTKKDTFNEDISKIVNKALKDSGVKNTVGVYVKELSTGKEWGLNENLTKYDPKGKVEDGYFMAASEVKVFEAYAAYKMIESGELSVDKTYVDPVTKKKFKLLTALRGMIRVSSNDDFNNVLRVVGNKKLNEVLESNGIKSRVYAEIGPAPGHTTSGNIKRYGTTKGGRVTAKDLGKVLEEAYNKKLGKYSSHFLSALVENIHNDRIPAGINNAAKVAHKTGTDPWLGIYHDAGVIYIYG
jgi:hypothetical protein